MKPKQKLLLLEDVEDLGKRGEVVSVKAGYARNFLYPKKLGVIADPNTLKMQERLQKERAIKAAEERKESAALAKIIESLSLSITVKVDTEGRMYGSVSALDVVHLLEKHNIKLSKKNILLKKHIKNTGTIEIPIKLKEDVETKVILNIIPDKVIKPKEEKKQKPKEDSEKKKAEDKKEENKETEEKK